MLLTVIVPVYNTQAYLEQAVRSVPDQKEIELLIIDDGSTDDSLALCRSLAASRAYTRVIHQENGGLSAARNAGLRAAQGDYVVFLDSDDFLIADGFDRLYKAVDKSRPKELAFAYYASFIDREADFDLAEQLAAEASAPLPEEGRVEAERLDSCSWLHRLAESEQKFYIIACRFIVRREFLLAHELFFRSGMLHEDEEWAIRLLLALGEELIELPFVFYAYRRGREGQITERVDCRHIEARQLIVQEILTAMASPEICSAKRDFLRSRLAHNLRSLLMYRDLLTGPEQQALWVLCRRLLRDWRLAGTPPGGPCERKLRRWGGLLGPRIYARILSFGHALKNWRR